MYYYNVKRNLQNPPLKVQVFLWEENFARAAGQRFSGLTATIQYMYTLYTTTKLQTFKLPAIYKQI